MKLQMTNQQTDPNRKLQGTTRKPVLVHRVTTCGTRCGIEMVNPIIFEGPALDITCKKCLVRGHIHEVL